MRIHLPKGIGMRRALFGLTGLLVAAAAEAQPDFRLDMRPEALVVEYREVIGGIASEDPGPRVSLPGSCMRKADPGIECETCQRRALGLPGWELHLKFEGKVNGALVSIDPGFVCDSK